MLDTLRFGTIAAALMCMGVPVAAQDKAAAPLLAPVDAEPIALLSRENVRTAFVPQMGPQVIRATPVSMPLAKLDSLQAGVRVAIEARPGLSLGFVVDRIERRSPTSYSVFASIPNQPESIVILSVEGGVAAGWIFVPASGISARLRSAGPDTYMLMEINNGVMPDCHLRLAPQIAPGVVAGPAAGPANANANVFALLAQAGVPAEMIQSLQTAEPTPEYQPIEPPVAAPTRGVALPPGDMTVKSPVPGDEGGIAGSCAAPQNVFDILVLYTAIARSAAGGTAAIQSEIQQAIDVSNQVYANSQINARMRLVHREEVDYNEVGTLAQHRDRLAVNFDGVLDNVHTLRSNFGADICCLWVNDDDVGTLCGIAYCTPQSAAGGFCIVGWSCAVDGYSFVHEIGHLQGSAHDPPNAGSGCNWFVYSFGHNFNIAGTGWRHTIMSYAPVTGSQRIPYFSNPNVSFLGTPTGNANRFNALSIANQSGFVSGWTVSRSEVWVDFDHIFGTMDGTFDNPFLFITNAVSQVNQGVGPSEPATIWFKPGVSNQTITINKPVVLRACGATVRIGQQ